MRARREAVRLLSRTNAAAVAKEPRGVFATVDAPPLMRTLGTVVTPLSGLTAVLIACVALYISLGSAPESLLKLWFNSDWLFSAQVYRDLFVDHFPISGMVFPTAPCLFPDVILTVLCVAMSPTVLAGTLIYGFIQFAGLIVAFQMCGSAIDAGYRWLRDMLLCGSAVAVALHVAQEGKRGYPFLYYLFLPTTHIGSYWMVILCCALALYLWRQGTRRESIGVAGVAFCALSFAAGFSDLMFLVHLTMALTCVAIFGLCLRLIELRRTLWIVGASWIFALAGWAAKDRILRTTPLPRGNGGESAAALQTFIVGFTAAFKNWNVLHLFAILFYALSIGTVLWLVSKSYRFRSLRVEERLLICFLIFQLCSGVGSLAAPIFIGIPGLSTLKDYGYSMKYMFPFFIGPLFSWPVLLTYWVSQLRWTHNRVALPRSVTAASVGLILWPLFVIARMPPEKHPLHSPVPPFTLVRQLDENATRMGLRYGLGGFWETRWINLLSQSGIHAYPIDDAMQPLGVLSNYEWYRGTGDHQHPDPRYGFIFLNGAFYRLSREAVISRFGAPSDEMEIDGIRVFVYGHNGQSGLNEVFRCDSQLNQAELSERGSVSIPAGCLPSHVGDLKGPARRTDRTGKPGYLTYGPYYRLIPGYRYEITFHVDAAGVGQEAVAKWDVIFSTARVAANGVLRPGMKEVHSVITVPDNESGLMEARVVDLGNGSLEFRGLDIKRLPN